MADKTDIGLVYTHPKSIGGHHDLGFSIFPFVLLYSPGGSVHTRMVGIGFYPVKKQKLGHILGFLPLPDIYQAASAHTLCNPEHLTQFILGFSHNVGQILTLKGSLN